MKTDFLPEGWRVARIADVAANRPHALSIGPFGSDLKTSDYRDYGVPIVFVRDVQPNYFRPTDRRYVSERKARQLSAHTVEPGDLVVTKMGLPPCVAAVYPQTEAAGIVTADIIKLSVDDAKADRNYVAYFLNTDLAKSQIAAITFGITRPKVTLRDFKEMLLPLPPLQEQQRIAQVLDWAEGVRAKRREALAGLDALTQAIFIKMFGDPAINPKQWRRLPLVDLCDSADDIKCGPFGTQLARSEYRTEGVPLWGIKSVNSSFEQQTHEFVEPQTARRLAQYSIEAGDIVMTRKGTVGNCAVYPSNFPSGIMHSDLLRMRISSKSGDPVFVAHQLHHSRDVIRQLSLISGGAIMPGINVTKLKSLEILMPPLPLQREFARRLTFVDKLKAAQRASLNELNALFASLQHRAFRGKL